MNEQRQDDQSEESEQKETKRQITVRIAKKVTGWAKTALIIVGSMISFSDAFDSNK